MDIKDLNNKIETLESKIKVLNARNQTRADHIKILSDKCDLLEAKYFKLLQAIDELRKDGETITIKELRRFKDWDEFNETMKKGHEAIKRAKNNKLNEEV